VSYVNSGLTQSEWWPYPIRYAWAATRGLPIPTPPKAHDDPLGHAPAWPQEHLDILQAEYANYRAVGQTRQLAIRLGRSEASLRKMASKLTFRRSAAGAV